MERLPECVLLRIFTALPLRCTLRLRLVCKAWNALLRSSDFLLALALHHRRPLSCFVLAPPHHLPPDFSHSRFLLFIPALGIWLHSHFILPAMPSALASVMPSAAHRHLVAISTPQVIRVFHLLTSAHYDITPPVPLNLSSPPFPEMTIFMLTSPWSNLFIFCDGADESYQLVLSEQSPAHHTLFIYSSKLETWRSVSTPFQRSSAWIEGERIVDADESIWNPTVGADEADLVFWNSKECMLATYCIEGDKWKKMRVISPRLGAEKEMGWSKRQYLAGGAVFECQGGRIVLVCAVVLDERLSESSQLLWRLIKGFRVWDLRTTLTGEKQWQMEVASAPAAFWEAFYSVEHAEPEFRPKFIYDGTYICMTSAEHISSQQKLSAFSHNKLGRYKPPLLYHLHLDSWSYLPRHSEEADDLVGLFTFNSSLSHLALHNDTSII